MDEQQTMPCKATGRPKQAFNSKLRPALPVLALFALLVLTGCDASAQNLTGAMKADAEARQTIAQAQLAEANAVFTKAQADADSQAAYARMLEESYDRFTDVQEARVRDMQMLLIAGGMLPFAGVVAVIGLHYATKQYPQMQPYQPAPQIVERIERQVIFINPADLPARGDLLRWGDVWVPRAQLAGYIERATGNAVQVWQEQE